MPHLDFKPNTLGFILDSLIKPRQGWSLSSRLLDSALPWLLNTSLWIQFGVLINHGMRLSLRRATRVNHHGISFMLVFDGWNHRFTHRPIEEVILPWFNQLTFTRAATNLQEIWVKILYSIGKRYIPHSLLWWAVTEWLGSLFDPQPWLSQRSFRALECITPGLTDYTVDSFHHLWSLFLHHIILTHVSS